MELKVWRGPAYNKGGEIQVAGYLDSLGLDVGYLLTFSNTRTAQARRLIAPKPRSPVRIGRKSSACSASS